MRLTHHACEQFATRYGGTEEQLRELVANAVPSKLRTPKGQEIWLAGEGGCIRLVIKRDAGEREPICVTVLAKDVVIDDEDIRAFLDDPPRSPVIASVPKDDAHLAAAAAAVDAARAELDLAAQVLTAAKNFVNASKARVTLAKERLRNLTHGRPA